VGRRLRPAEQGHRAGRPATGARRQPAAAAVFATLNSQNRFAIIYRIQDAKKPETRARRIEKFVVMLEEGTTQLSAR